MSSMSASAAFEKLSTVRRAIAGQLTDTSWISRLLRQQWAQCQTPCFTGKRHLFPVCGSVVCPVTLRVSSAASVPKTRRRAYSGSSGNCPLCCAERFWTLLDSLSSRLRPASQQTLTQEQGDIQLVDFKSHSTGQQDHLQLPHSNSRAAL